jgi:hypothetical protein
MFAGLDHAVISPGRSRNAQAVDPDLAACDDQLHAGNVTGDYD